MTQDHNAFTPLQKSSTFDSEQIGERPPPVDRVIVPFAYAGDNNAGDKVYEYESLTVRLGRRRGRHSSAQQPMTVLAPRLQQTKQTKQTRTRKTRKEKNKQTHKDHRQGAFVQQSGGGVGFWHVPCHTV